MHPAGPEAAVTTFERERRRLFGVAYRMLGSIAETEDILQDACLRRARLKEGDRQGIENPGPYLTRMVTRLCIDARRSAHARRMTYVDRLLEEAASLGVDCAGVAKVVKERWRQLGGTQRRSACAPGFSRCS